jgi:hypothetical protein
VFRFLRYLCAYCAARLIFNGLRSAFRQPAPPAKPCNKHGRGMALTFLLALVVLPCVGSGLLILLGFIVR